jgi:hypothetical protein
MNDIATKKSVPMWFKVFWIIFISSSIIVAIVAHINFNQPLLGKSTFGVILVCIIAISSYLSELKPSKKKYRLAYMFYFGLLTGILIWVFIFARGVLDWMMNEIGFLDGTTLVLSFLMSWGFGAVVGDLIGRFRKYKGPGYSPVLSD